MAFNIDRSEDSESMVSRISLYEYEARIGQQPTKRAYIFNDSRMREVSGVPVTRRGDTPEALQLQNIRSMALRFR